MRSSGGGYFCITVRPSPSLVMKWEREATKASALAFDSLNWKESTVGFVAQSKTRMLMILEGACLGVRPTLRRVSTDIYLQYFS